MSNAPDNLDAKMEAMLRQWGAAEASKRAPIGRTPSADASPDAPAESAGGPAPSPRPAPMSGPARGLRWALGTAVLAAAAGAVVGFVVLTGKIQSLREDAEALSRRARDAEGKAQDLLRKLEIAGEDAREVAGELQRKADRSAREANEALAAMASLRERLSAATAERDAKAAEMTRAVAEAERWKAEAGAAAAKLAGAAAEANAAAVKVAVAAEELERSRKVYEEAVAARKKAETDLDEARARQTALWGDFRQAYLAAAAPGEKGLRAAQTAARRSRLAERCGKVRSDVDAAHRPLLEKLEVVLMRLDTIDQPDSFVAEEQFAKLLQSSGLLKQMDEALEARGLPPAVRAIFFEARLILQGAEHAG